MTNAEMAILSLVAAQPRHGYQIERVIEERGMRDWTEVGFSSIYYLLKKLERKGLVESQLMDAERGPARKVYQATPAGREAYHDAARDALSAPRRWTSTLLLGLSSLSLIPPAVAVAALHRYCDAQAARRDDVYGRRERQRPLPAFIDAMFDYSLAMIEAEIAWVEKYIKEMEDQHEQG
jgi:DNA-binding PadR family transcriptional regulator